MKLEVGRTYFNGFGVRLKIVKAPTAKNRWYEDELENRYHEDGAAVRWGSSRPDYNLREDEP